MQRLQLRRAVGAGEGVGVGLPPRGTQLLHDTAEGRVGSRSFLASVRPTVLRLHSKLPRATNVPAGAPPISVYERRSTAGLRASAWGAHLGLLYAQLADVLVGGGALPALLPLGLLALLGLLGLLLPCGRLLRRRAAPRGAQMSGC